jgi:FAD/FMN-containing dehydrogenase
MSHAPTLATASDRVSAPTRLSGWGANLRADCLLFEPETPSQVRRHLDPGGTIARGLGRSYGDPALNSGGLVLGMSRLDRYLSFDEQIGMLCCEAGVSLGQIIRDFTPRGFFPMITPGTKYVTIGGCIANDVHGKAHHAQGSFSACVDSMTILLGSGAVLTASRTEHADLFWATFGGMGLLGIVLTATVQLRRIETTYFRQKAVKAKCLEALLEALEENDRTFPYSVATIDPLAVGARLGSGMLTVGDHASLSELPAKLAKHPLWVSPPSKLKVPFDLPAFMVNPLTIRVVNGVIMHTLASKSPFDHYDSFFYPLDSIEQWNRLYGQQGFTQYQFVLPFADGVRRMREILTTIMSSGRLPFLNVLKRLGRESDGPLSFPREGYTFAIDFPVRENTAELIKRLDAMVLDAGGRIYLGKDAFVDAATFRAMYPRVGEWLEVKKKYDPDGVFVSDLARRVGLTPKA